MAKIRVYGHGDWIDNSVQVRRISDADVVVMPGGGDWNPALYNEVPDGTRSWYEPSDRIQMAEISEAIDRKKVVFGICRGLQGVTIANGGKLVQHIQHPSSHPVKLINNKYIPTNSCHHQMCNPFMLPEEDYRVLGWTEGLSNVYLPENSALPKDENGNVIEPEIIWYPKTRCVGWQSHPEWMESKSQSVRLANEVISQLLLRNTIEL